MVAGVVGAVPWWLPAAIVQVAAGRGVVIGGWRALGWRGVEYRDVRFENDAVAVHVDRVRAPVFGVFPRGHADGAVRIEVGNVEVRAVPGRGARREVAHVAAMVEEVEQGWAALESWLPRTRVDRVAIVFDEEALEVESLIWDGASVQGAVRLPERGIEGVFSVVRPTGGTFVLQARMPGREVTLDLTIVGRAGTGASARGNVAWLGSAAALAAEFGPTGVVPVTASIEAPEVVVPAGVLGLEGYGPVQGGLEARWSQDRFSVALAARAASSAGAEWPPLAVDVRASGDRERVRIDAMDVHVPAWQATLSRAVEYEFARGVAAQPAEFAIEGDLAVVPGLDLRGRVSGSLRLQPTGAGEPELMFRLSGARLGWREVDSVDVSLSGAWRWPELSIRSAVLEHADGRAEVSGVLDCRIREVRAGRVRTSLAAGIWQAFAPGLPKCERVDLAMELDGPWALPRHRGSVELHGVEWMPGQRAGGRATWSGEGPGARVEGAVVAGEGRTLPFVWNGSRDADGVWRGSIEGLRWSDAEGEWWRLVEPVVVRFEPASSTLAVAPWTIKGDGVQVSGEAHLRWPASGDIALRVEGLEGRRLGGVVTEAIRDLHLEHLTARARWDHGPVHLEGAARTAYAPAGGADYVIEADFSTSGRDLALGSVRVADASGVVLRGIGRLPLEIVGDEGGFRTKVRTDGAIALDLDSEPNPVFWRSIADLTGWAIEQPRLRCRVSGSLAAPRGEAVLEADVVRPPAGWFNGAGKLPRLGGLRIEFAADDSGLSLAKGRVAIDDRWVTLSGHAPWGAWSRWRETGVVPWRQAAFELASNPLPIEMASRVFPTELAPVGEVSIKIGHEPGPGLTGRVWLHGAALRPVGPLGSIRDINSEIDFSGYVVRLARLEGVLAGQTVRLTGQADVTEPDRTGFDLRLTSSRVPLVRRAGLIIRAELDLELRQLAGSMPRVSGRVDFGPSLYRTDLLELMHGGVDSPSTRPPYFSIEEKPFADWELDVAVQGKAFLQLVTPFYRDTLSTDLRLSGTLGEPRAEGWVWGAGGVIVFPFGTIPVEQMLVTLSRDNPYEPRLVASGAGRIMGYDVRMEASGPASEPRLLFSSDPPLTSQQVFLMLTTGAVPDEKNAIGTMDRAGRLAMYLGRNLAAGLGLGGGREGEERLTIRSGENFTREGRETIHVQYDLDGRWSVVGEYDRFDAYNGGIKFRLISR